MIHTQEGIDPQGGYIRSFSSISAYDSMCKSDNTFIAKDVSDYFN